MEVHINAAGNAKKSVGFKAGATEPVKTFRCLGRLASESSKSILPTCMHAEGNPIIKGNSWPLWLACLC